MGDNPVNSGKGVMLVQYVVLCLAALAAGAINSVAGGGTLLTFPALVWVLGGTAEATVLANATSTVALFPGALASVWGYRREFTGMRRWLILLSGPSIVGGLIGSLALVQLPEELFKRLIPYLILTATLLFLSQPLIAKWTGIGRPHETPSKLVIGLIVVFQFMVAIYGGYFGAGIGILMLSALAVMGMGNIHQMNAIKSLLGGGINGIAVAIFIWGGRVEWRLAIPMLVAGIIGGFSGASIARRLPPTFVRWLVIGIGLSLSTYYFVQEALKASP